MDKATRNELDRRLEAGFAEAELADARVGFRERLRDLKSTQPEAFDRAVDYYENTVAPAILQGGSPLETWVEYGRHLGTLSDEGRLMTIDSTGRAADWVAPVRAGELVLFVPESGRNALVVVAPTAPSAAQSATIQLLVEGRLSLA